MSRSVIMVISTLLVLAWSFSAEAVETGRGMYWSKQLNKEIPVYVSDSWPGEYPMPVVRITEEVKVIGKASVLDREASVACKVAANSVYHPWAQKIQTDYVSLMNPIRNIAKEDLDLHLTTTDDEGVAWNVVVKVQKDQPVDILTFYGENFCLLSAAGIVGESECPWGGETGKYTEVKPEVEISEQYFLAQCKDGSKAWIQATEKLFTIDGVEYGEIVEFGTVKETIEE